MARKSSRTLWADKLAGKSTSTESNQSAIPGTREPFCGIVLGIDPSLRGTGLAVIEFSQRDKRLLLHSKTVRLKPKVPMSGCLAEISRSVTKTLERFPVDHVALEQTIYVQNFQTAQILGAARGAAIAAAAVRGLPIFEYPPLRVKQAVVGFGRASKEQVARQVQSLLSHGRSLSSDEADAAGVAMCHAMTHQGPGI